MNLGASEVISTFLCQKQQPGAEGVPCSTLHTSTCATTNISHIQVPVPAPCSRTTPTDALKKYNKVQMEELSPDAIAAARMRRSRER